MNVGGPAVEISQLMQEIDPTIIKQRLATGYCRSDEAEFPFTAGLGKDLLRIDGFGRRIRVADDLRALRGFVKTISQDMPDIVHTHTAKAGILGRLAVRLSASNAKVVHTYHGHLLHGYFGPMQTRALVLTERWLARWTDRIVAVGRSVMTDLLGAGIGHPSQYSLIRSGVRLGRLPEKTVARGELGLPQDRLVVSMIGRLTQIKRPDRFLDVVEILQTCGLSVHFLVAGGGDQSSYLENRVRQQRLPVTYVGWQTNLERLLAATDVVLLTSDNEGTPLVLLEAAQAGLPVVATRVGSVEEVTLHGVTGILCGPSVSELAGSVETLLLDQTLRERLGRNAKEMAETRNWRSAFVLDHQELYERLADL